MDTVLPAARIPLPLSNFELNSPKNRSDSFFTLLFVNTCDLAFSCECLTYNLEHPDVTTVERKLIVRISYASGCRNCCSFGMAQSTELSASIVDCGENDAFEVAYKRTYP